MKVTTVSLPCEQKVNMGYIFPDLIAMLPWSPPAWYGHNWHGVILCAAWFLKGTIPALWSGQRGWRTGGYPCWNLGLHCCYCLCRSDSRPPGRVGMPGWHRLSFPGTADDVTRQCPWEKQSVSLPAYPHKCPDRHNTKWHHGKLALLFQNIQKLKWNI